MPVFKQCCCCSLKAGCKTLASFAIIGNILCIALAALNIGALTSRDRDVRRVVSQLVDTIGRGAGVGGRELAGAILIISIVFLVFSVISLIVYSCLIHGVNHRKAGLVVPSLVFIPLQAITFLVKISFDAKTSNLPGAMPGAIVGAIVGLTFYVLIWLVVLSSWQEIRDQKKTEAEGNRGLIMYSK